MPRLMFLLLTYSVIIQSHNLLNHFSLMAMFIGGLGNDMNLLLNIMC